MWTLVVAVRELSPTSPKVVVVIVTDFHFLFMMHINSTSKWFDTALDLSPSARW